MIKEFILRLLRSKPKKLKVDNDPFDYFFSEIKLGVNEKTFIVRHKLRFCKN